MAVACTRVMLLLLVVFATMRAECQMACQHPCCDTCREEQALSHAAPAVPAATGVAHWPDAGPVMESVVPAVLRVPVRPADEIHPPPPLATPSLVSVLKI